MSYNEITIKPEGCDFMNYNETVKKSDDAVKRKEGVLQQPEVS